MKLTARKAIEICRKLWLYLEETGGYIDSKHAWVGWKKYGEMHGACPCCEYRKQRGLDCEDCLLKGLWGNHCGHCPSPYFDWKIAQTKEERKKYARIIRKGCDKWLKEHKED